MIQVTSKIYDISLKHDGLGFLCQDLSPPYVKVWKFTSYFSLLLSKLRHIKPIGDKNVYT